MTNAGEGPGLGPPSSGGQRGGPAGPSRQSPGDGEAEPGAGPEVPGEGGEEERMRGEVEGELVAQREYRRAVPRKGEGDVRAQAARQEVARTRWLKARKLLTSQAAALHLQSVRSDIWVDIHTLFYYYNEVYFGNRLQNCVVSWINREDEDRDFRYCLCVEVPAWWDGPKKILGAGISCHIERQVSGAFARTCHIRLPDALRKFKLVQETKATLLHEMIHAYIYVTGQLSDCELSNEHGRLFRQNMHRINNDTLTFDAYRPRGGYRVSFDRDVRGLEDEEVKRREVIDGFSPEHWKILYLVSRYSQPAELPEDPERWIRQLSLLVLLYEGIVTKAFDYDYAPTSVFLSGKRVYLNITQEGRDNIDDLLEVNLLRALRMVTQDNQATVSYQCTTEGLDMLHTRCSKALRAEVDAFIFAPGDEKLLNIEYDGKNFFLRSSDNLLVRESTVTDTEDVSYVTSPYLPRAMRSPNRLLTSNSHRAIESSQGRSNIKDELDVAVTLTKVVVLVGEWIPFGCSQMMEMSNILGAHERTQGGYFSPVVDMHSTDMTTEMPTGLTHVTVNCSNPSHYLSIEAEVEFPEDEGIIQVEQFGIRYQRNGSSMYGLKIESVMDKVLNDISLDNLARVMADVHIDSSMVTESLISEHQRKLLDMVFCGHADQRNKVNIVVSEGMQPRLKALAYLDGDSRESEIRQVIGDTYHAFDISENDVVIFGSDGVLFAGPGCLRHETLLLAYLSLKSRESFMLNFFNRLFIIDDHMKDFRKQVEDFQSDPNSIPRIRAGLNEIYEDITLLEEIVFYLNQSLDETVLPFEKRPGPHNTEAVRLLHVLHIDSIEASLKNRVQDCSKQIQAAKDEVGYLQSQLTNCSKLLLNQVQQTTSNMYKGANEQMKQNDAQSVTLDVMQMIFVGGLSFALVDRLTGEWTILDTPWGKASILYPLILPGQMWWLLISLIVWAIGSYCVMQVLKYKKETILGLIGVRFEMMRDVDLLQFNRWVKKKRVVEESTEASEKNLLVRYVYEDSGEIWEGYSPKIEVVLNRRAEIIERATVFCTKHVAERAKLFPHQLRDLLLADLETENVLVDRKKGVTEMTGTEGGRKVFYVQGSGEEFCYEVALQRSTMEELTRAVSSKMGFRIEQLQHFVHHNVVDGQELEEVISTNMQVSLLAPYSRLIAHFHGRKDPDRATFQQQLVGMKSEAARGRRLSLMQTVNPQLVAKAKRDARK